MRFWAALCTALLLPLAAQAETATIPQTDRVRIATFNTELSRKGPGLLLRDLLRQKDPQIAAVAETITAADPDILLLQGMDWDLNSATLNAFADLLAETIAPYPHRFAPRPNNGLATGLDMDGNGRLGDARDAQGYGRFTGQGGMALLSRHPIHSSQIRDLSALLWKDLPGAVLPVHPDGSPFPSAEAQGAQRLSSKGHWVVPIQLRDDVTLTLMAFQATTPLFDGEEDRNGLRNRDEIRLWQVLLDGDLGPMPTPPFVIAGGASLDPRRGAGHRDTIFRLLQDPRLQDPRPTDADGHVATVNWGRSGRMRVDYLVPSRAMNVLDAGLIWPAEIPAPDGDGDRLASRHALVWIDLEITSSAD
ncbi:endonuclease/exonuclease/phosphatase [Ruegeria sp. R11]|nr:endonuclease/exonuclease/phosphatase [Ruegeria sp. R11]